MLLRYKQRVRVRADRDLVDHSVGKALDQFGIEHRLFERWIAIAAGAN